MSPSFAAGATRAPVAAAAGRARLVDALLAVGVTAVVSLVIAAGYGGRAEPDPLAYLWAVGLGALMLARRRFPVVVLLVSTFGLFAYYAAGYPIIGVAVPVAAALFSAAEAGRIGWAIGVGALVLIVSAVFQLLADLPAARVLGTELAGHALLVAASIALGDAVRSRRLAAEGARALLASSAERERLAGEAADQAARETIARDLHDSMGHATSVVALHAQVAREALGPADGRAAESLDVIAATTRDMMAELRTTVRRLRVPAASPPLGAAVAALVGGLPIDVGVDLDDVGLAPEVREVAFRIVQEGLTNVTRHSAATRAEVDGRAVDGRYVVTVVDQGPARSEPVAVGGGLGLVGLRERVTAARGAITAGPRADGGYELRAELPLAAS